VRNTIDPRDVELVKRRRANRLLLGACMLGVLSLSSCGGGKIIQTVDDSVNYESAKELPPLRKPSRANPSTVAEVEEPVVEPSAPIVSQSVDQKPPSDDNEEALAAVDPESDQVLTTEPLIEESQTDTDSVVVAEDVVDESVDQDTSSITASVVEVGSNSSRLEITAGFESAWNYLVSNLQSSDVTVFARNKSAARMSIGCAGIDDQDSSAVEKRGRWSFFNRDKKGRLEYCSLQFLEKRGVTQVSVVNRSGQEVLAESSNAVFERILNN